MSCPLPLLWLCLIAARLGTHADAVGSALRSLNKLAPVYASIHSELTSQVCSCTHLKFDGENSFRHRAPPWATAWSPMVVWRKLTYLK